MAINPCRKTVKSQGIISMLLRTNGMFLIGLPLDLDKIGVGYTIKLSTIYFKCMVKYGWTNSYLNIRMYSQETVPQLSHDVVKEECFL